MPKIEGYLLSAERPYPVARPNQIAIRDKCINKKLKKTALTRLRTVLNYRGPGHVKLLPLDQRGMQATLVYFEADADKNKFLNCRNALATLLVRKYSTQPDLVIRDAAMVVGPRTHDARARRPFDKLVDTSEQQLWDTYNEISGEKDMPKKFLIARHLFTKSDEWKQMVKHDKNFGIGTGSKLFNALSDTQKQKYMDQEAKERQVYVERLAAFHEKYPQRPGPAYASARDLYVAKRKQHEPKWDILSMDQKDSEARRFEEYTRKLQAFNTFCEAAGYDINEITHSDKYGQPKKRKRGATAGTKDTAPSHSAKKGGRKILKPKRKTAVPAAAAYLPAPVPMEA